MLMTLLLSTALVAAEPDPAPGSDDTASWDAGAAGIAAVALVLADFTAVSAGVLVASATRPRDCYYLCVDPTVGTLALIGVALVPPTVALLFANSVHGRPGGGPRALLAFAAQGAAIGMLVGAASTRSGSPQQTVLLVSAAAFHFVGVPVALGFVPPLTAPGSAARTPGAPTLGLSFSW